MLDKESITNSKVKNMDRSTVSARWNAVFRGLAAEPRREIVLALSNAGRDQAVQLPAAAIPPDGVIDREQLRISLHHTHLPMLSDNGYVEWSTEPFVAERGPAFPEVQSVLEAVIADAGRLPDALVEGDGRLERSVESG